MTFTPHSWVKNPSSAQLLLLQRLVPRGISWHDGVTWALDDQISQANSTLPQVEPTQRGPSWLPDTWNHAVFLGWNRWGQPVVEHPESGVRHVRRGLRVWQPFDESSLLCADVLYLKDTDAWTSTLKGWKQLCFFATAEDCIDWLMAMGYQNIPHALIHNTFSSKETTDSVEVSDTPGQLVYHPLSQQPHAAFVPFGLGDSTAQALQSWQSSHPDTSMDDFVSRETKLDLRVLSGEQVDAVGLAVSSIQQKAAFLLGDQTGLGKGRVLASLAIWAQSQGLVPVFFTERPGLFHDFWRDMEDVTKASDPFSQAFILHQTPKLTWPNGDSWKNGIGAKQKTDILKSGKFPENVNLVLTTYSQFNRKDETKINLLKSLGSKALYLFDEAHNATGQSNVRDAVRALRSSARGCVYASATFGKDADHVSFYTELLGKTPYLHDWAFWLGRPDAEPLRVAVSRRLVRAGRMVRREQDLSGLVYTPRAVSQEESAILAQRADDFAKFGAGLLALQTELAKKFPVNSKHKIDPQRLFGGRLYRLNRLMALVCLIPSAIRVAQELLANNVKPVLVCETTLEQALSESEDSTTDRAWASLADVLIAEIKDVADGWVVPEKGAQADALRARQEQFEAWTQTTFQTLPPSPLDAVRLALSDAGIRVGEVSGRQQRLVFNQGLWEPAPIDQDRVGTVRAFNAGELDALIVTRAGCSGISLHASRRFKDQRARELVEWQIPRNVAERVQFFGRVYRKDQVVPSGVSTLLMDLPSERRGQIWQSRKMQRLFQFTVGQQQAVGKMYDQQEDYLERPQADAWAKLWVQHYPQWASLMGLGGDGGGRQVAWMDRLFSRLSLLNVKRQEALLAFWDQSQDKLFPSSEARTPTQRLATFDIGSGLELEGYLTPVEACPIETPFDESQWDRWVGQLGDSMPYRRSFFDKLAGMRVNHSLRWRDASRRKLVTGRVLGVWLPPTPFEDFWPAVSIHVWSPELNRSLWVPLHQLLNDTSFQLQSRAFPMEAAAVAHEEQHRVVWALRGAPEHLLLWKTHQRVGEWASEDPHRLWLPSFLTPERLAALTVPLGQPQWVLRHAKLRRNVEELMAYDAAGRPMHFSFSDASVYTLTWTEGAQLEDGELVSVIFRQNYGSPRRLSDGRMAFSCDTRMGVSLLFHLVGRGVVFGVPSNQRHVVAEWESDFH